MPNTPNNTNATNQSQQQVPPQTVATTTTVTSIDSLRTQLHKSYKQITQREPLDLSYQFYLLNNGSVKPPQLPKDDMYSSFNGNVRDSVESYLSRYGTRMASQVGRYRSELGEEEMKAAFTMRECKEFEQKPLIQATLLAEQNQVIQREFQGVVAPVRETKGMRKRVLEGMVVGLQDRERKKKFREKNKALLIATRQKILALDDESSSQSKKKGTTAASATNIPTSTTSATTNKINKEEETKKSKAQQAKEQLQAEQKRQAAIELQRQREREREEARKIADQLAQEERELALSQQRRMETPQQALYHVYQPMFQVLWDMEYPNLNGTNPFRIVIDAKNCEAMGVPDYCDIIKKPMNLTYIQEKVNNKNYVTLQEFFEDIELLIANALLYNSDPMNPFHVAANVMKKRYLKERKKVLTQVEGGT